MSFEPLDFSALFDPRFRLDRAGFLLHLAIENRIVAMAERALLLELIERPLGVAPPRPSEDDVQEAFHRMQVRLDYRGELMAERLVEACSTDLEETYDAFERRLARRSLISALIRRALAGEADAQQAICWEAFTAGTLRAEVVRAVSLACAARAETDPPGGHEVALARRHLLAKHEEADWHQLAAKLTGDWGLDELTVAAAVDRYALALRRARAS